MTTYKSADQRTRDYQSQYIEHNGRLRNGKSCHDDCAVCSFWRRKAASHKPAAKVALNPDVLSTWND